MRLRFTIRDLLWLTLAIAVALAWRWDRRQFKGLSTWYDDHGLRWIENDETHDKWQIGWPNRKLKRNYAVSGEFTDDDLDELGHLTGQLDKFEIEGISAAQPETAEVRTRHSDSGGSIYQFEKRKGKWRVTSTLGGWVS